MKARIKQVFYNDRLYNKGEIVELNQKQAKLFAEFIEEIPDEKPARKSTKKK